MFVFKALKNVGVSDERAKELILSIKDKAVSERLKQTTAEALSHKVTRL